MPELKIKIPEELEREMEELPIDWSEIALESIKLKVFESHISKSKALQRAVIEALSSKSKLTKESALELGRKVNDALAKRYKLSKERK